MRKIILLLILTVLFSCTQQSTQQSSLKSIKVYEAGETILETLKTQFSNYKDAPPQYELNVHFYNTHFEEILASLEIVETVKFVNKKEETINVAFYKYFVGSQMYRNVEYFKEKDGKYYTLYQYISQYNVSKTEEELAKKIEDWVTDDVF